MNDARPLPSSPEIIGGLERDIPALEPCIPAETLRRYWTMLAHVQGGLLNAAALTEGPGMSGQTVDPMLLMLVRQLLPWHENIGKHLVGLLEEQRDLARPAEYWYD